MVRVQDPNHIPPDLLKDFDHSLLEPSNKIPEGNVSCIAFVNYTLRTLQMTLCESNVFKHPFFFNITWQQMALSISGVLSWDNHHPGVQHFVKSFHQLSGTVNQFITTEKSAITSSSQSQSSSHSGHSNGSDHQGSVMMNQKSQSTTISCSSSVFQAPSITGSTSR